MNIQDDKKQKRLKQIIISIQFTNYVNKADTSYLLFSIILIFFSSLSALFFPLLYKMAVELAEGTHSVWMIVSTILIMFIIIYLLDMYRAWYSQVKTQRATLKVDAYIKPIVFEQCIKTSYLKFDDPNFYDNYIRGADDITKDRLPY